MFPALHSPELLRQTPPIERCVPDRHTGSGRSLWWALAVSWLPLLLLACLPLSAWADDASARDEKTREVKAAFIYNFLKFVEWPATNTLAPDAPILIGVAEDGPMVESLTQTVKGRRINGHELQVKLLHERAEAQQARVLFIPGGDSKRISDWLAPVQHHAVLTISESQSLDQQYGIITFVPVKDKIHFMIDMDAADRAGLTVSAQLQKLGQKIWRNR